MPAASAVGSGSTRPCPTSRGHGRFFAFLVGRWRAQTAASPRAGACRLRSVLWGRGWARAAVPATSGRQCRRPAPLARGRRTHAPRAGGMGASLCFWRGGGECRRRQAHEQGLAACVPAVPTASGRQCRRPAPSAPCTRAHAPRAGGMGASLRFWRGGGGHRRRQAHEQGLAACGGFWGRGRRF